MKFSDGMPHIPESPRKNRLDQFAPYVAVLPWFNTNILHKLYINVFKGNESFDAAYTARAITCADVLHSPCVKRIIANVFVLETEIQDELRQNFSKRTSDLQLLGQFMQAYAQDCREHFLGPAYIESYRIESNFILHPNREAIRISRHIVNRLNQVSSFEQKKKSVGYYLDILEKEGTTSKYGELIKFLKGVQDFDTEATQVPGEWKALKNSDRIAGETISIKIPLHVRDKILREITPPTTPRSPGKLFALLIGINQYQDRRIYPLNGAVNDARAVEAYLHTNQIADRQQNITLLLDRQATRKAIISSLGKLSAQIGPEDTFLFYFAGYGGSELRTITADQKREKGTIVEQNVSFLYCADSLDSGIVLDDLFSLIDSFPKTTQKTIILDSCFQRNDRESWTPSQKIRSLAEPTRVILDTPIKYDAVTDPFNRIVLFAAVGDDHAYEADGRGFFTDALLNSLKKLNNVAPLSQLKDQLDHALNNVSTQKNQFFVSDDLNLEKLFLEGYLKKIDSNPVTSFFIETGMDAPQLKDQVLRYLDEHPDAFALTEDRNAANYLFIWQPEEMWICRQDEEQRPVTTISIRDPDTLNQAVRYFAHIARWEKLRQWEPSPSPHASQVELQLFEVTPDGEIPVPLTDDTYEFEYDHYTGDLYRKEILLKVTNHGVSSIHCSILYFSDRFEINSEVIDGNMVLLNPGQSLSAMHGEPIQLELKEDIKRFNAPFSECYFKLLVHHDPFGAESLDQPPLPAPGNNPFSS